MVGWKSGIRKNPRPHAFELTARAGYDHPGKHRVATAPEAIPSVMMATLQSQREPAGVRCGFSPAHHQALSLSLSMRGWL